jgi:hypothetical protein
MAFELYDPNKAVSVVNKPSLRPGQLSLYKLIVEKIDKCEILNLKEAESIWLEKVHSDTVNGIPYRMDYYAGRHEEHGQVYYTGARVKMTRDEIEFTVMNWLMKNIGLLVIRGYLKVIPTISLKELS